MRLNRFGARVTGLTVLAALLVSACGGAHPPSGATGTTGAPAAKVACGGKPVLKASGSTAQANG